MNNSLFRPHFALSDFPAIPVAFPQIDDMGDDMESARPPPMRSTDRPEISRPRELRRSVGTWLGAAGLSSKQVGALLGHKSDITSKVHIQLAQDAETKAAAVATQAELIKKFGGSVVSIADARTKQVKRKRKRAVA